MERTNSRHHLLFPAAEWSLRPEGQAIRTTQSMIAPITRADHDYMHEVVPIVPALGHNTLRAVSRLWVPQHETYQDLDGLCLAIETAAKHEKSHHIETELAGLAIEALLLEKDVLKEVGYKDGRHRTL